MLWKARGLAKKRVAVMRLDVGDFKMTNVRRVVIASVSAVSVLAFASAALGQEAPKPTDEQTAAMMKSGAKIYKDYCASCHLLNGEGVPRVYPPLVNNPAITMRNPVNPTESARMPEQYRRFLEELFRDDLRKLQERFGLTW